jgi:hypothetical protein
MVGSSPSGGLVAKGFNKVAANNPGAWNQANIEANAIKQSGGHAIIVGSTTSLIKRSVVPGDTCSEPKSDRQSVLGFSKCLLPDKSQCTNFDESLFLISTIGDLSTATSTGSRLCDALAEQYVTDAILLDGGHSASMAHNGQLLNQLTKTGFRPARQVLNAISVTHKDDPVAKVTSITPTTAHLNQRTVFIITGENLPDSTVAFIPFCQGDNPSTSTLTTYIIDAQHRKFACKPIALGMQTAEVKNAPGGDPLTPGIKIMFVP